MENSNFEDKTKEDICQLKIMVNILKYLNVHIMCIYIFMHTYIYLILSIFNYYYNFKIINSLR